MSLAHNLLDLCEQHTHNMMLLHDINGNRRLERHDRELGSGASGHKPGLPHGQSHGDVDAVRQAELLYRVSRA